MGKAVYYFFVFIFYQIASAFVIGIIAGIFWPVSSATAHIAQLCIVSAVASLLTLVTSYWAKWYAASPEYIKSKPYRVLLWSVMLSLGLIIPLTWLQEMLPDKWTQDLMQAEFSVLLKSPMGYLVIGLIAPIVEEVVFRGAILRALLEWGKENMSEGIKGVWTCIIISALLFSIAHFNPAQMPHAFVIGCILGWMYWRTGSIIPGIMFHLTNNTVAFVIAGMFPDIPYDAKLPAYFNGDESAVIMAVICSLIIALPCLWRLNILMKRKTESL